MQAKMLLAASAALSLAGCVTPAELPATLIARASLTDSAGQPAGTAMVYRGDGQITISVALIGLAPGIKQVRLQQGAECDWPGPISPNANPDDAGRTYLAQLHDALIGQDRIGTVSALLPGKPDWVIPRLLGGTGSAVVVSAPASQKAGEPGQLVACGALNPA